MSHKLICLILAFVFLFCGCAEKPEKTAETCYYSFTDSTGAVVTLKEKPNTVAVLFSSYSEIWTLAGGRVNITVGESVERGFASENTLLVDTGAGKTVDCERLLEASPDLVIGSADIAAQAKLKETLATCGIPIALFRVDTFSQYLYMLKICTDITRNSSAYTLYGTDVEKRIMALKKRVGELKSESKEILFIRAGSKFSSTKAKSADDNFVCKMLNELSAKNIADEATMLLDGISVEEILLRDPDYIFLSAMGSEEAAKSYIDELFKTDGWRELSAVKEKNYTFLDKNLFHFKPNARWDEAYTLLAELLYPELRAVE